MELPPVVASGTAGRGRRTIATAEDRVHVDPSNTALESGALVDGARLRRRGADRGVALWEPNACRGDRPLGSLARFLDRRRNRSESGVCGTPRAAGGNRRLAG